MADSTKIQWCDHTWNPWRGCEKVSPGCENCYAEAQASRNNRVLGVWGSEGAGGTRVVAAEAMWREPARWDSLYRQVRSAWIANHRGQASCHGPPPVRPRVFCASLSDVFEAWSGPMTDAQGKRLYVPSCPPRPPAGPWVSLGPGERVPEDWQPLTMEDVRSRLFRIIINTTEIDWLLLTKRPQNVSDMWPAIGFPDSGSMGSLGKRLRLPNVWLGVTAENQAQLEIRMHSLPQTSWGGPAGVFLSCEPLLGPLDLSGHVYDRAAAVSRAMASPMAPNRDQAESMIPPCRVGWVIVGGESGPDARPCQPEWIAGIIDQCRAASVPVFVKQLGDSVHISPASPSWPILDESPGCAIRSCGNGFGGGIVCGLSLKGGDPSQWPPSLNVRQFPVFRKESVGE